MTYRCPECKSTNVEVEMIRDVRGMSHNGNPNTSRLEFGVTNTKLICGDCGFAERVK